MKKPRVFSSLPPPIHTLSLPPGLGFFFRRADNNLHQLMTNHILFPTFLSCSHFQNFQRFYAIFQHSKRSISPKTRTFAHCPQNLQGNVETRVVEAEAVSQSNRFRIPGRDLLNLPETRSPEMDIIPNPVQLGPFFCFHFLSFNMSFNMMNFKYILCICPDAPGQ